MKPDEEQSAGRIEQALRESEDRFRDFLEIAAAWFWETDEGLRIVRLDGRAPLHPIDQVIGRPAWDILGGDPTAAPWRDHIATMQAREPFRNFEVQVVAPDGTPLWVASSGRPVFAADGTFRGYRGIAVDITAHKRAESEARGEAALFEATLEHMDQGLLMIDATETVRVYNHRILELLDLPEDLLAQRPNFLAVREYQLSRGEFARSNDAFRQWVENRGVNEIRDSYERVRPDGRVLEIRTVPLPDGGAVRTYTDITARRQAEAELKASEERYRALVTASSSMIWRADADGFILEGFGRDTHPGEFRAAYQGHGWIDEVHPEDRIEALAVWNGILASAEPGENRFRLRRTDGQYRWFVSRMAPLKNPDGSVREWIGSLTDIHEHRAAQTVLWETNERLASALRAGRMMAWDWNLVTGRVTRSDTSLDVLGLPSGDIGAFLDRIPEEDRTAYLAAFEAATRGGGAYDVEYRFHKPDGQTAWMRETGQVDFAPDGKAVRARGLVFDISQRKQAEESLQESERRLSTLLDNLPGFAYRCRNEPHWPMDYVSEGIRAIAGYAPADLQEPAALSWADIMHPDDRELVWSQVQDAVRLNRPFEFTYRVRTRGGEERWVRERGQGVRRANGELEALEGFISDITEQRRTEERLRQSQKMEAVGQLTGGIAHDFNNLLTVILGNAEILVDDPGNPALTRTLAQMVVEAAEKGAELTQHLLAFGRRQSLKPVRVSLDHVVRGMTPLLQRTLGEHIELRTDLANSLHAALTDRTLLESAILNLAVNAKDAMPQGGTLTITCGEAVAGPDQGALPIGQDVVFVT
ncbi:MAG TPA: PAS domain-containing protein, partial [Microvirga sp.]|nr:PAS domain-containing protein [Microvirga sp.]